MTSHQIPDSDLFNVEAEIRSSLRDMSDEHILSLASHHEESTNNEHIELNIYFCYSIFLRMHSMEHLDLAIQRTEKWIVATAEGHTDRARRLDILDMMMARRSQDQQVCNDDTLHSQFEETDSLAELDQEIQVWDLIFKDTTEDDPDWAGILEALGDLLGSRFKKTGLLDDLNRGIKMAYMAVDATPQDHPDFADKADRLSNLGTLLSMRFERTGSMDDLNGAIKVARMAIDVTPQDHPNWVGHLNNLGNFLGSRFKKIGLIDDLNDAIKVIDMAFDAILPDHPHWGNISNALGFWLGKRYERTGSLLDLNRAIKVVDAAVGATRNHSDQIDRLNNLGNLLGSRFDRIGSMDDLNCAIKLADIALDASPQDLSHKQAIVLSNLGFWLGKRFERTGSIDDLDRAIKVVDTAVDATQDHPDQAFHLHNLGDLLGTRSERTGSKDDLEHAIKVVEMAVDASSQDDPNWVVTLKSLGIWLGKRFKKTGSMRDLNRAIKLADMAVNATPQYHLDRPFILNNHGNLLGYRFERTGSIEDLNHAIKVAEMAVDATPQDNPGRAITLSTLETWLSHRFERIGVLDDLDKAIKVAQMAVDAIPQDHPDQARQLSNLGACLGIRFMRTGSMEDLNQAIKITDMLVDAAPQEHVNQRTWLTNLGIWLGIRFARTGSMDDLNPAIKATEMAIDATTQDHTSRARLLNNLAYLLSMRSERTGSMDDLNRAIKVADMVIDATPQDHVSRAGWLGTLGNLLGTRFEKTGLIDDLNRGISMVSKAADAIPKDHPHWAVLLNSLGGLLSIQFDRTGSLDDLNHAIKVADKAVDITPQDHPDLSFLLNNLGNLLSSRFEKTGLMEDLNRCLSSYTGGWNCLHAHPSYRIQAAQNAAKILASQFDWKKSSSLLQAALELLPAVNLRYLQHTDKQHILQEFAGLASMATAAALNSEKKPYRALQLLESGRGMIASLLMEMRGDISDLEQQYPKLANEFASLRDKLDFPTSSPSLIGPTVNTSSWKPQTRQLHEENKEFNELITKIRAQPGFQHFLLPPTPDDLMAAADPDPIIVVNISSFRCDAFLVEHNSIRVLELPNLKQEEVQEQIRVLKLSRLAITPLLKWLWDNICGPCLDALGFKNSILDNNWPRVWWVPTGMLSQLPIHAAGHHMQGSTEAVIDRVMSSYTSSIKALIQGRRNRVQQLAAAPPENALLVAMRETPGLSTNRILPFVDAEAEMFRNLCLSLQLTPIEPILRKDDVLRHLANSKIFHFAGHGRSDPVEPSQSCLLLEDWQTNPLTVGDLRDYKLQKSPPFLGYLSACSTGANEADRLLDEGIHLVSALQLAGFRHVVGTLWEVSDKHCVDVARVLYETICREGMTDLAVCQGLHQAIRALRDGQIERSSEERDAKLLKFGTRTADLPNPYWVPYVHFGV
jgi:tetratricopeptide (TPR) repeat protein